MSFRRRLFEREVLLDCQRLEREIGETMPQYTLGASRVNEPGFRKATSVGSAAWHLAPSTQHQLGVKFISDPIPERHASIVLPLALCLAGRPSLIAQAQRPVHHRHTANGLTLIVHETNPPDCDDERLVPRRSGDEKARASPASRTSSSSDVHGLADRAVSHFRYWSRGGPAPTTTAPRPRPDPTTTSGPSNSVPAQLWLEADRMGWLLPGDDAEKLDLQRDV